MGIVMEVPQKTKNRTTNRPAIPPLSLYQKKCTSTYYRDICTPMLVAALQTIAKL
jgi:hypothetical protein